MPPTNSRDRRGPRKATSRQSGPDQYSHAIALVPDGPGKTAGIEVGEQAARMMVALRQQDGTWAARTPGPILRQEGVVSNAALRKPFVASSNAQSGRAPCPPLSAVKEPIMKHANGVIDCRGRTPWQTETARFWEQLGTTAWNDVARSLSATKAMPLADGARLFALLISACSMLTSPCSMPNTITTSGAPSRQSAMATRTATTPPPAIHLAALDRDPAPPGVPWRPLRCRRRRRRCPEVGIRRR